MDIPAICIPVLGYIARATELEEHAPLPSFYAHRYAAEKLAQIRKDHDGKVVVELLLKEIEAAERIKAKVNTANGQQEMEAFCLGVFKQADTEEKAGEADKGTIVKFTVAVQFFDVLTQFGPLATEFEDLRKYAKFKATEIKKRLETVNTTPQATDDPVPSSKSELIISIPPPTTAPVVSSNSASDDAAIPIALKKVQHAASALSFRDVTSAITNLRQALQLLEATDAV